MAHRVYLSLAHSKACLCRSHHQWFQRYQDDDPLAVWVWSKQDRHIMKWLHPAELVIKSFCFFEMSHTDLVQVFRTLLFMLGPIRWLADGTAIWSGFACTTFLGTSKVDYIQDLHKLLQQLLLFQPWWKMNSQEWYQKIDGRKLSEEREMRRMDDMGSVGICKEGGERCRKFVRVGTKEDRRKEREKGTGRRRDKRIERKVTQKRRKSTTKGRRKHQHKTHNTDPGTEPHLHVRACFTALGTQKWCPRPWEKDEPYFFKPSRFYE